MRLTLSKEAGIPAYQIFSDAALKEMEQTRPMTDEEFMQISGVGRKKMQNYGHQFITEIRKFFTEKTKKRTPIKGATHLETLSFLQKGLSLEEIATERKLALSTIQSHIMTLYKNGEDIDLKQFISATDLKAVENAKITLKNGEGLKAYYDHLGEAIDYATLKFALTILEETLQS